MGENAVRRQTRHLDHGPFVPDEGMEAQPPQLHAEFEHHHHQGEQLQGRVDLQQRAWRCGISSPLLAHWRSHPLPFSLGLERVGRTAHQVCCPPGAKVWPLVLSEAIRWSPCPITSERTHRDTGRGAALTSAGTPGEPGEPLLLLRPVWPPRVSLFEICLLGLPFQNVPVQA